MSFPSSQEERKETMLPEKQRKDPKSAVSGMKKLKLSRKGYINI